MLSRKWVPLPCFDSFCVLTCLSICALQFVSAPCLLGFFLCPNLSVHLCSSESECLLLTWILYVFWLVCLCSSESKCPLLPWILSVFWLVLPSVLSREWVSLICFLSFWILMPSPSHILHSPACMYLLSTFLFSVNRHISPLCVCQNVSCFLVSSHSLPFHTFHSLHQSHCSLSYPHFVLRYCILNFCFIGLSLFF